MIAHAVGGRGCKGLISHRRPLATNPPLPAGVLLAAMMAGFAPQTCFRSCCQLAAPFPASLRPGARFRAAHPPRPHVGSGVHRRGGLGWVKGRRAYEQSPRIYAERRRGFTPPFNKSNALLSVL